MSNSQELVKLSEPLLKSLNLLTRDGQLNADARRKLKQIEHLVQFIRPELESLSHSSQPLTVVDMGAGKSYLGFLLWDLYLKTRPNSRLYSVELRTELVERAQKLAQDLQASDQLIFLPNSIEKAHQDSALPDTVSAVTALHACDTATDDTIVFGLKKQAQFIALVPCCQAEVAQQLGELTQIEDLYPLWRRPIHRREFGSHLTNVIRSLYLEAHGYKVTVTELTGWEHSMKNELILAKKVQGRNGQAQRQLNELLQKIQVKPKRLFSED